MDSISSLFTPILRASWYAFALAACIALGLPTTTWRAQSPENVLVDMVARMLEILSVAAIEAYRGMFLRFARGDWLTILARETYETPRLEATFASCVGDLFNSSVNVYNIPAGDVLLVQKTGIDVTYAIDGPLVVGLGLTSGLTIRCLVAGSQGNAAVGEINQITGQTLPGVSVTNTSEATGRDIELDTDLASRAILATGPTSPGGPAAAYEYIAKGGDVSGTIDPVIATIGVTRVKTIVDIATGLVTAYFGTPTGGISGTPTTGNLGAINQKILEKVVPSGTPYQGLSGTPITMDVEMNVYVTPGVSVTEAEVQDQISADLKAFIEQVPIHGYPEITPTPGYLGSVTILKVVGFGTNVIVGGIKPIDAVAGMTINGALDDLRFAEGEFPVPGTILINVIFQ